MAISLSLIVWPALGAEYIVVRDIQRNVCEVVTEKPSYREWVQIGEQKFPSLEEASVINGWSAQPSQCCGAIAFHKELQLRRSGCLVRLPRWTCRSLLEGAV